MTPSFYSSLPVLPLKANVIFPQTSIPIHARRSGTVKAIEASTRNHDSWIVVVTELTDSQSRDPKPSQLATIGTLARIEQLKGSAKEGYQMILNGTSRFKVENFTSEGGYLIANGENFKDQADLDPKTAKSLLESLKALSSNILDLLPGNTQAFSNLISEIDDLSYLGHLVASNIDIDVQKKQSVLETINLKDRSLMLLQELQVFRDNLSLQQELNQKLNQKMGKAQREAILREQMRNIQEELGEGKSAGGAVDYRAKIEAAKMPEEVNKVALDELARLESLGSQSQETHVIRNYLDLLVSLPWNAKEGSEAHEIDIAFARKVLNEEHFGLEPVKKKILEHLAILKLKKSSRGQILLLVGPPGVGKTSLGQSIAHAMNKKFMRVSLGGVRDDAEIRGHRRTYVGAMPGKLIQTMKRAGEADAVIMLDEIDKLSRGYSGDPAAALLEVLDPEQNKNFMDHYLDVPYDLSKVFFIATANSLDTIPGPLLDRMEVIEISGYTTAEKLHIAKNHLIPKLLEEFGMTNDQVKVQENVLLRIMNSYTREAGVRDLKRKISSVLRSFTEELLTRTPEQGPVLIEETALEPALGQERYSHEVTERISPPGVVTGLAWTPMGGEILFIESSLMPGSGKLILTGQLGDVMKESVQIAQSLLRSHLSSLVPLSDFEKKDVHVHVPAGATPKDGPSAGVTMLTSLASVFLKEPVNPKIAMTGEITLRGAVMPVGGIKEKIIAAHRAGVEKIILSKKNERDLAQVPEEVRNQLKFVTVENVTELLQAVFDRDFSINWETGNSKSAPTPFRHAVI